jgi:hypothetical protein
MILFPFRIKPQSLCDIHECSVFFLQNQPSLPDIMPDSVRSIAGDPRDTSYSDVVGHKLLFEKVWGFCEKWISTRLCLTFPFQGKFLFDLQTNASRTMFSTVSDTWSLEVMALGALQNLWHPLRSGPAVTAC